MAHEAFMIASLCGAIAWHSFDDDSPTTGMVWVALCVGWAIMGINRALA